MSGAQSLKTYLLHESHQLYLIIGYELSGNMFDMVVRWDESFLKATLKEMSKPSFQPNDRIIARYYLWQHFNTPTFIKWHMAKKVLQNCVYCRSHVSIILDFDVISGMVGWCKMPFLLPNCIVEFLKSRPWYTFAITTQYHVTYSKIEFVGEQGMDTSRLSREFFMIFGRFFSKYLTPSECFIHNSVDLQVW